MISLIATLWIALSARAEQPWFDAAAFRQAAQGLQAAAAAITASNALPRLPPGSPEAQRVYNTLFPYYAELCTVTQYNLRHSKPGGSGGHATMFLNGAEIDPAAGYPRLRLAAEGTELSDPDSGTGISVNKVFANVNWVAIAGRGMFFRAGLAPDRRLTKDALEGAIRTAAAAGWFDGIEIHEELLAKKPPRCRSRSSSSASRSGPTSR